MDATNWYARVFELSETNCSGLIKMKLPISTFDFANYFLQFRCRVKCKNTDLYNLFSTASLINRRLFASIIFFLAIYKIAQFFPLFSIDSFHLDSLSGNKLMNTLSARRKLTIALNGLVVKQRFSNAKRKRFNSLGMEQYRGTGAFFFYFSFSSIFNQLSGEIFLHILQIIGLLTKSQQNQNRIKTESLLEF